MEKQNLRLLPAPVKSLEESDKTCELILASRPFGFETSTQRIGVDATLARILAVFEVDRLEDTLILVNGREVPREYWHIVRPKPGCFVTVHVTPGGDDILRTVLTIGVFAVGIAISGGLLGAVTGIGALGAGTLASTVLGVGFSLAGAFAVNSLIPPSAPALMPGGAGLGGSGRAGSVARSHKESQNYDIERARNSETPWGPIPVVMGRLRVVPPYGAKPYTEIAGDDEYLRMIFLIGYGPLQISSMKIGNTPLDHYEGVEVEVRRGNVDDPPLKLYTRIVNQENFENLLLSHETDWVTRSVPPGADEIIVDLASPTMRQYNDAGAELAVSVNLELQYSVAGANAWSVGATEKPFAARLNAALPPPGSVTTRTGTRQHYRSDLVILDSQTAAISTLQGPEVLDATPERLPTPAHSFAVCAITRHGSAPITQADIRYLRYVENGLVTQMAGNNDFAPTATATPSNQINIGLGGFSSVISMRANSGTIVRRVIRFATKPGTGYDVRIRRLTEDHGESKIQDKVYWSALRTVTYEHPINKKGLALVALRIKAYEQLNGVVDEFSCIAQSVLPAWTGTQWEGMPTNNPAALYRYVLQGEANNGRLPNDRVDMAMLQDWSEFCEDRKLTFNLYYDFKTSVAEVLTSIASAGCAARGFNGTKRSVIIDRAQVGHKAFFSPNNTSDYELEYRFDDQPHALRCPFKNEKQNWVQDELEVFADGFDKTNAHDYFVMEFPGVTQVQQLRRLARRRIAELKYRYKTYKFTTHQYHLTCTRGDLVAFANDATLIGTSQGRITSIVFGSAQTAYTAITLDIAVPMISGRSYNVRIQTQAGEDKVYGVNTVNGPNPANLLTFTTGVAVAGVTLNIGDIALFGEANKEKVSLIVQSIEMKQELTAELKCVPYEPAIFTSDTDNIPDRPPVITDPPGEEAPFIAKVTSDESVMLRRPNGSLVPRIVIDFGFLSNRPLNLIRHIEAQYRFAEDEDHWTVMAPVPRGANRIIINQVAQGRRYRIRVRYLYNSGRLGPWSIITEQVVGKSTRPPKVTAFSVQRLASGMRQVRWQVTNRPPDFAGIRVKYNAGDEFVEDRSQELSSGLITGSPYETSQLDKGLWSFAAWSVDDAGNQSGNPFLFTTELGYPPLQDALLQVDPAADGYPGLKIDSIYNPYTRRLIPLSLDTLAIVGSTWANWEQATIAGCYINPVPIYGYDGDEEDVGIGATFTPRFAIIVDSPSFTIEQAARDTLDDPQVWVPGGSKVENRRYFQWRIRVTT